MKKLSNKGKIHPSPPPPISDHLSLLPATILTLTVALSPQDREVLAYLISCSGTTSNNFSSHRKTTPKGGGGGGGGSGGDHPPQFNCNCFGCYMSYWVRWDNSPNREIIHEIIDGYEDGLFQKKNLKNKKERRKRKSEEKLNSSESDSVKLNSVDDTEEKGEKGEMGIEKSSVRKLVSFIGERIWGVWGI